MKNNPVYKRESMVRARSIRMPFVIFAFNAILALASILNMYQTVEQVRITSTIQYSNFLHLYSFVAILEFLLLMGIMPALTSGSISGERERKTLELLFTTKMTSKDIILGKLFSALEQMFVLMVSSLPIILLTFVYGSVDMMDFGLLFLCYGITAIYIGAIGIFFSVLFRRSTFANVCTYGVLLLIAAGSYLLNGFLLQMSELHVSSMALMPGEIRPAADSSAAVYLLLLNPVSTFIEIMGNQVSGSVDGFSASAFLGNQMGGLIVTYWVPVSLLLQTIISVTLIGVSICFLNPVKQRRETVS